MPRPPKERQLDIPRRAVEVALELLERHGPDALTTARIAAAVGCSAPALYHHFRDKDALLRAVHDAGFEALYRGKLAIAARTADDAFGRLREGGIAYLRFALERPALYRLMFDPPPLAGLGANPFEHDLGMKSLGFLAESVRACQAEGWLPGRDPERLAFTLWSTVHGAASLLVQGRSPLPDEDPQRLAEATVDAVMDLIDATRSPPPAPPSSEETPR